MEVFVLLTLQGQAPQTRCYASGAEAYAAAAEVMTRALRGHPHPQAPAVQALLDGADAQGALRLWHQLHLGAHGSVDLWVQPHTVTPSAARTANTHRHFLTLASDPLDPARTLRWAVDAVSGAHFLVLSQAGHHHELTLDGLPPGTGADLAALQGARLQDGNYATLERTLTEFCRTAGRGTPLTCASPQGVSCHLN